LRLYPQYKFSRKRLLPTQFPKALIIHLARTFTAITAMEIAISHSIILAAMILAQASFVFAVTAELNANETNRNHM